MLKYRMPSRYLQLPWLLPGPLPDSKSCYHNSTPRKDMKFGMGLNPISRYYSERYKILLISLDIKYIVMIF